MQRSHRSRPDGRAHERDKAHVGRDRSERGQGLAEFAIVIPFLIVLFMGVLEFALAFGATLGVNRASQNAAHVAASAGGIIGADCLVLRRIEQDIGLPNDAQRIQQVVISRQALGGNLTYEKQTWSRAGMTDCVMADGSTIPVPYTLIENGYPESSRCTVLAGCPLLTPARSTVDSTNRLRESRFATDNRRPRATSGRGT